MKSALAILTFLAIAVVAVPAGQAWEASGGAHLIPIDDGDPKTDERARNNTSINAVSFKTASLVSVGGYQYTSYYDVEGKLIVGRRNLASSSPWQLLRTEFTSLNINDAHNTSSIAIDGDGTLHLAWGVHGHPLLTTRSTAPVTGDQPLRLVGDEQGNGAALTDVIPLQGERVTYPQFYSLPDSGDLLLTYRTGASGNGKFQLVRWNNDERQWIPVHASISNHAGDPQPWIDSDYEGDDMPNACAYHNGIVFDSRGRLHTSWCWRTGPDSKSGYTDYQTNHNLMYAYSDDGGRTWRRDDGTPYERDGRHDIDEHNAPAVVVIPEGSSLKNQVNAAVGPDDVYYVATSWAPRAGEGNHTRQFMLATYDGNQWRTHQIGERMPENNNQPIAERDLARFALQRPIVLVDDDNRVYVVLCDHQRNGAVTVAISESPARDDWQFVDIATRNMGRWDPTCDLNRWRDDRVISLFYLPGGAQAEPEVPAVLEWDPRAYFQGKTGK